MGWQFSFLFSTGSPNMPEKANWVERVDGESNIICQSLSECFELTSLKSAAHMGWHCAPDHFIFSFSSLNMSEKANLSWWGIQHYLSPCFFLPLSALQMPHTQMLATSGSAKTYWDPVSLSNQIVDPDDGHLYSFPQMLLLGAIQTLVVPMIPSLTNETSLYSVKRL